MKTGIELIKEERERQINEEGYSAEHDDGWAAGELADAASCYALNNGKRYVHDEDDLSIDITIDRDFNWPFPGHWKPSNNRIRELQKAGALIAAEIDRLLREQESEYPPG